MTIDTAAIRARAEKAKHSPWKSMPQKGDPGHCFVAQIFDENGHALADLQPTIIPELASDTAAHIAGLHPEIAISLCDEIDRLRAELASARAVAKAAGNVLKSAKTVIEGDYGEGCAETEDIDVILNKLAALRAAAQKPAP